MYNKLWLLLHITDEEAEFKQIHPGCERLKFMWLMTLLNISWQYQKDLFVKWYIVVVLNTGPGTLIFA